MIYITFDAKVDIDHQTVCVTEVVSDFDTFTVGSKNMVYESLPMEQACRKLSLCCEGSPIPMTFSQAELIAWTLEHTEAGVD